MCGIVGILGTGPVSGLLVDALRRLEYRGYDSAGIATLVDGKLARRRAPGKLKELECVLTGDPLAGNTGIGHTRWATHGAANKTNAHPHATDKVALVHNGIIENFRPLREELAGKGVRFHTETDTEVIAQMITHEMTQGAGPGEAVKSVLDRLEGAFALAIIFGGDNDLMIGARRGSPLAVGYGDNEMYLGSDAIALAPMTNRLSYLEEGDWVVLTRNSVEFRDRAGRLVNREIRVASASTMLVDKGNHKHFMAKEIAEQPEVIGHTLAEYLDLVERKVRIPKTLDFTNLDHLTITACGTAYYAGLVAKYWFESLARLPVDVDVASEFRYRGVPLKEGGLSVLVSQSGETADTLAALRYCREHGQHTLGIINVRESSMGRECDTLMPIFAGPEIGVASTKAFTCQLAALACLAVGAARARGTIPAKEEARLVDVLFETPRLVAQALEREKDIEAIVRDIAGVRDILYVGRGSSYPIALEGALKLKEISYIHAEGYAAGELKHGPIALIDENVPVIIIAPRDELYDKTMSNMEEVAARGGRIVLITDEENGDAAKLASLQRIQVPDCDPLLAPILYALPVQMLAYHTAVFMGTDVDQPRNLAKSVTVE